MPNRARASIWLRAELATQRNSRLVIPAESRSHHYPGVRSPPLTGGGSDLPPRGLAIPRGAVAARR